MPCRTRRKDVALYADGTEDHPDRRKDPIAGGALGAPENHLYLPFAFDAYASKSGGNDGARVLPCPFVRALPDARKAQRTAGIAVRRAAFG